MLRGEHSAILSSFIKLPIVIKRFVLSIFEWPLRTGFTVFPFLSLQMLGGRLCRSFQSGKHLRCRPCTVNQSSISLGVTAAAYQKNVNHCYHGHTNSDRFLHGKRYPISGLQIRMHNKEIILLFFNQNLCCGYAIDSSQ